MMHRDEKIVRDYVVEKLGTKINNYFRIRCSHVSELVLFDDADIEGMMAAFAVAQKRRELQQRLVGLVRLTVWRHHALLPSWVERIG